MFGKDPFSKAGLASLIDPAVLTADNTPVVLDLADYRSALIALSIGAGGITFTGTNKIEFIIRHGNQVSGSAPTYAQMTDITAADLRLDGLAPTTITTGIVRSLVAAKAAADVQRIGYIGSRRYIALLADFSGTHATGTAISATAILMQPRLMPV
jgi:hypothetical protein